MALSSLGLYTAAPAAAEVVVNDNTLYANGTPIVIESGEEYGGNYTDIIGAGSETSSGDISGGNVTINTDTDKKFGQIFGGYSSGGNVHDNHVTINSGVVIEVYGGIGKINDKDDTLTNNTVTINGGTVTYVFGGSSNYASVTENKVYITGGTINSTVVGGQSNLDASSNIVDISDDARVNGDIYGGYSSSGSANNNEIIISGSANITNANLYGRNSVAHGTGNTLTIDGWSGSTQSVQNFSDINFNNVNWKNGETVLKITNGSEGDLINTNINLNSIAGGSSIKAGDKMTLIASNTNLSDEVKYNINDTFTAGVAREGLGSTSVENGNVTMLAA